MEAIHTRRSFLIVIPTVAAETGDARLAFSAVPTLRSGPQGFFLALRPFELNAERTNRDHGSRKFSVDWSPDGKRLVTAIRDMTLRIWGVLKANP